MNYTLIGTGNMAWFMAQRLQEQGYICAGVYGRNPEQAEKLAETVNSTAVSGPDGLPETEFCMIAVTDHAIRGISHQLSLTETTVIHTAGSVALDALDQKNRAVLWPVYSINRHNIPEHRNIPVVYEADTTTAKAITYAVAGSLSDIVTEVSGDQRQWLHLCAVLGNNFTNHLMAVGESICRQQGLDFSLLRPILQQTFENISVAAPSAMQTGPAKRHDTETLQAHMHLLSGHSIWQQVYHSLSASIEDMYKAGKEGNR